MDCRVYGGDESQRGGMEEGKVADAGNQEGNHHVYTTTYSTTCVTVRLFSLEILFQLLFFLSLFIVPLTYNHSTINSITITSYKYDDMIVIIILL